MGDFFTHNLWEKEPDFARDYNEQGGTADAQSEESETTFYGAQHVIALVDCHPDMFQEGKHRIKAKYESERNEEIQNFTDNSERAPIHLSIKLIQSLLQQIIEQTVIRKIGKRNGVGLLFYNTRTIHKNSRDRGQKNSKKSEEDSVDDDDDKMDDEEDEEEDEVNDDDVLVTPRPETTVHRLLDLEPPGIRHVQTLRKLVSDNHPQRQTKLDRDLRAEFCPLHDEPHPAIAPLQIALEEATRMFLSAKCVRDRNARTKENERDTKSIWVFTNQANPYSDERKKRIENIANLAKEQDISIVVWPLGIHSNTEDTHGNGDVKSFDPLFFGSIASRIVWPLNDESSFESTESCGQRLISEDMMKNALNDIHDVAKIRRTYYGPMHILRRGKAHSQNKPSIMIDWYSLVQFSRRPGKVQVNTETKIETVKIRYILEKDTGKDVARFWNKPTAEQREHQRSQSGLQRIRHFFNFANELVPITQQDIVGMKENANGGYTPGLTILGFKPRNAIPFHHTISKPFVIFPNDDVVKGSFTAFKHLHAAMLRKNVIGVGEVLHRQTSQSRLVAIYPFERADYMPDGMYVITLPFENDMRAVAPDAASMEFNLLQQKREEKKSEVETAYKQNEPEIIGSNGNAGIPGAGNQHQENELGSIASEELVHAAINLMGPLGLTKAEVGVDFENAALMEFYSYLKSVAFDSPQEEARYDTRNLSDTEFAAEEIDAFKSLLPADAEQERPTLSRKRARKIVPDDSGIDWDELYRRDEIDTCNMDMLKKYLRSVGLSTSGRKNDLVLRVASALAEKCSHGTNIFAAMEQGVVKKEESMIGRTI